MIGRSDQPRRVRTGSATTDRGASRSRDVGLPCRRAGSRRYIDLHVQYRSGTSLERAHELAHAHLRNAGLKLRLPAGATPNLSLILGGGGTTLEELVGAYTALAREGVAGRGAQRPGRSDPQRTDTGGAGQALISGAPRWHRSWK